MLPLETHTALQEAAAHDVFLHQPGALLYHAALSACFWAMLLILFGILQKPREHQQLRLVKARGTVIVETLIVFPVFLLTSLGLLQLTILNTAGLLTSLGAFKAGRSISVWAPEADHGRNGVNYALVNEKARLAAALAVTPVDPADFVYSCDGSTSIDTSRDAMKSLGHAIEVNPNVQLHGSRSNLSLSRAFDHSNFFIRGQSKLSFAWCATDVEITPSSPSSGENFTVTVRYQQQMAMPFVEIVFGSFDEVGGRGAFYTEIQRSYATRAHIEPNADTPGYF